MALSRVSGSSAHGAISKKKFYAGEKFDTVIFPLMKKDNADIFAWEDDGNRKVVNWHWKNPILIIKNTSFIVEDNKYAG
ncbi:hypothetical protein MaudCBS49596_006853, partial [Microsporum audouinii]